MNQHNPRSRKGPEKKIQEEIEEFLTKKGWLVVRTHGSMYQSGFPDDYITHKYYGPKWVEIKNPKSYCFTPAQLKMFPKFCANGAGVWVLVAPTETEYLKIFGPANWWKYIKV